MNNQKFKSNELQVTSQFEPRFATRFSRLARFNPANLKNLMIILVLTIWSLGGLYAQTFSGGSGTQANPYKISKPQDLVELSNFTNTNGGVATVGQYFVMTNNIDMAGISNFRPIGLTDKDWNTYSFCGNFDGSGFVIKNLSIIDTAPASPQVAALFGEVRGAKITNVVLDNASFSSKGATIGFVGCIMDSLYVDSCIVLNCILKGSSAFGFTNQGFGNIRINNSHVINVTIEGNCVGGFYGISNSGLQITNSSVRHSTLTGSNVVGGFIATMVKGRLSNCYVSNCILSSEDIGGFVYMAGEGEMDNCGVQALLSRTKTPVSQYDAAAYGFVWSNGSMGIVDPLIYSNCYAACEFKSIDNIDTNDYAFCMNADYGNVTITNSYYLINNKLGVVTRNDILGKSESYLKNAAMVAYPSSQDNSLNYNQSSKPWKQDLTPPINKEYPILGGMQPFSYVSTYHPTNLNNTTATLQGVTFSEGEPIVEHGFQWREKGAGSWTKVIVTDTTFNISYALAGLTKNTTYEYFVYMKAPATQHGDTVQFTTLGDTVGIVNYLPETSNISIYPNPTDGQLRITNYKLRENTVIEIFSIVGQVVGAYRIRPEATETIIDISHLSNGIYFMKIDGKTVKIVKQ